MLKEKIINKIIFEYNNKEYYVEDILNALKKIGVKKGDSIFIHSDLKSFGKINHLLIKKEFLESFLLALKQTVGKNGNIIMPTFTYSFCKDEIFDPETTPSTVGILTEYFRTKKGTKRSSDPIFSVAAYGPDKDYFTKVGSDCFGDRSIFEKLYEKDVKIIFFGNTFDITYIHFIEQKLGVPYRFLKKFKGKIKSGNKLKELTFNYYVRDLEINVSYNLEGIADYLDKHGILKKANLGYSKIRMASARDTFNILTKGLKKDLYLLIKN